MTRWERMKATFKGRKPVSTAEIVSDIRAGTVGALQPVVRVGERFREAQPEVAERISRTATAGKIRESVQIRKDIDTAKRQIVTSEKNLVTLDKKIALAPVRDGIFTGTDKQFLQHEADVKAYNSNINRINTENKRISTLEGKKFIPKLERSVSSYIPTLADISKKGAQFRVKYPVAASTIYTAFERAHDTTERVGTQSQRNALAGYTYGSYSSLQRQPVKTAASFAIGGASVKAIKMAGLVGKAYGAGKWTKRMAKAAQYGLLAYYGKKSIEHIMKAPNSYVAGQRAANIMYTEVLPMAAGIKAVTVGPKVMRPLVKQFKTHATRMMKDNTAMVNKGKTPYQRRNKLIKSEETRLKRPLTKGEKDAIDALVGYKAPKTGAHKPKAWEKMDAEYKRKLASGKYEEVKIGTGAQQQIHLVKVVQKPLTKQTIKQVAKVKEQFELISKPVVKPKVIQKHVQKVKVLTEAQKAEAARLQKQATLKQAAYQKEMQALADQMPAFKRKVVVKTVQKQVSKSKTITKQIIQLKQKYNQKLITRQVYVQKLAQLNKQKLKLAQQQTQLQKTVTKVKPLTAQKFAQQLTTSFAVMQLFKQAQKQEAKLKAKQLPKQKQKIVPLLTPAQEAALITKQEIAAARKAAVAEKVTPKPPRKVTPKPVRKPAIKVPKLIVPPVGPLPKRKAKKKPIRKDRQIVTYTPIQFKNRVATIASLFG